MTISHGFNTNSAANAINAPQNRKPSQGSKFNRQKERKNGVEVDG